MIKVNFICGDLRGSAMIPKKSHLYKIYEEAGGFTTDIFVICILDFLSGLITMNAINNKKLFIEKIIYYGVIDLEGRIVGIMNNREYHHGIPYGQNLYYKLFGIYTNCSIDKYYITVDDFYKDTIHINNYPYEVVVQKDKVILDNNHIIFGGIEIFYNSTNIYDSVCITETEYRHSNPNMCPIKIGDYYLFISEYFTYVYPYDYGKIIYDNNFTFNIMDKDYERWNYYTFTSDEILAINNIVCTDNYLYYKVKGDKHTYIDYIVLGMLLFPSDNLFDVYEKYYTN